MASGWVSIHSSRVATVEIDPAFIPPPCRFVTVAVGLAMVTATERDDELIADPCGRRRSAFAQSEDGKDPRVGGLEMSGMRSRDITNHADPLIRGYSNRMIFC